MILTARSPAGNHPPFSPGYPLFVAQSDSSPEAASPSWTSFPAKGLLLLLLILIQIFALAGSGSPGAYVLDSAGIISEDA
jgi:hypothetical protein